MFISSDGEIIGKHRKLKPTYAERTAWAEGDGSGLARCNARTPGSAGSTAGSTTWCCPAYALMADGTQVHVAAFPGYETAPPAKSGTRQLLLSRRSHRRRPPTRSSPAACSDRRTWRTPTCGRRSRCCRPLTGDSYIIDPFGDVIAGPIEGEGILVAEASLDHVREAKAICDAAGHYSRPDILQLVVNRQPAARVIERS